ncbi:SRPBCC family protein [Lutimonas saemankumensis]|uniref:SRPBCC domain-containing protein n=1 Tax=Lutimonas saemankumensis TaxID=483016 RepID=UPI001CD50B28|nr:SRPBCC family protein [Lutimonas saemankumensis]MCA0932254.1 SRPBCC family protein [Lutimonas saemankumensis]
MNLESPKVTVKKSSQEVFDFLSKVENFERIMPENIDKFEASENSFLFALKGMPEIKLQMKETEAPKKIVLGSASEKFPFNLTADIEDNDDDSSDVQLLFDGEFNPMVAMMVKKPLQKFIDTLIGNIGQQ